MLAEANKHLQPLQQLCNLHRYWKRLMFNISNSDQTVCRTRGMLPSVRDDLGFAALIGFVNDFCKAENPTA
jgi:hypothetical protein